MRTLRSIATLLFIVIPLLPDGSTSAQMLTTLWSFAGTNNAGVYPQAPLVQGSDGYLYGTTTAGEGAGVNDSWPSTVFRISPSGSLSNLYSFSGNESAGVL